MDALIQNDADGGERDPDRFNCPHPGCNRSFAELWRLKVHYRAPPDIRGSGKERGHGTELAFCPKCNKDLRPGKHHVGCSAGKSTSRLSKKARQAEADGDEMHSPRPQLVQDHMLSMPGLQQQQANAAFVSGFLAPGGHQIPSIPGAPAYYICAPGPNGMAVWQGPPGPFPQMGTQQYPALQFPTMVPHMALPPHLPHLAAPGLPALAGVPAVEPLGSAMPPLPSESATSLGQNLLGGIFDDLHDDLHGNLGPPPSPPPLPADFAASMPGHQPTGQLFDFGQFSQKMPSSQPVLIGSNKLVKDLTQEALDLAEDNVVYETQDDGELMKLLFGIADEMPTMATIHLHKFPSQGSMAGQPDESGLSMLDHEQWEQRHSHPTGNQDGHAEPHIRTPIATTPMSGISGCMDSGQQQQQHHQQGLDQHGGTSAASHMGAPGNHMHGNSVQGEAGQGGVKQEPLGQQADNQPWFSLSGYDPPNGTDNVKVEASEHQKPSEHHMLSENFLLDTDSPCRSPWREAGGLFGCG